MMSNTTIILPTFNEEKAIHQTIKTIQSVCDNPILVIDGHSTDNTTFYASTFDNVEIIYDVGKGKGAALKQAFADCYPDNVVFVDVDGTYDVHRIPEIIDALDSGYDSVTASYKYEKGAEPTLFGIGLWSKCFYMWKAAFLLLYGKWNVYNLSGFRGLSRHAIEVMDLQEPRYGIETEITVKTIKANLRHCQIDTVYHKRVGESKLETGYIFGNITNVFTKQWREVYYALIKYRFWRPKWSTIFEKRRRD